MAFFTTEDTESTEMRPVNELTELVIGAAIEVHRHLGPGLLESAYEACLSEELKLRKINFSEQLVLPIEYKGKHIENAYRLDFMIEEQLIIELKAVSEIHNMYRAQLLSYLKLSKCKVGLLINFNVLKLVDGIQRIAL
ncbi:MAG: GxxExxY protein [Phycisphaeraceae bacterium JB051]